MFMPTTSKIIQLKITLTYSKPATWRRIAVPSDYSFFDLHVAIQDAFGWYDQHLHQFFTDSPFKRNSQYERIALPLPDDEEDVIDERKVKISKYLSKPGDVMFYEYDFGDSWEHQILVENILPAEAGAEYPVCLAGKRACPPEDCGGIWGYDELLEIIRDPTHEEYKRMTEWLDGSFDPEEFNIDRINQSLRHFRQSSKSKRPDVPEAFRQAFESEDKRR